MSGGWTARKYEIPEMPATLLQDYGLYRDRRFDRRVRVVIVERDVFVGEIL